MTPAEIGAVSRLGGHAFAGLVSRIEQVHQAIAGRALAPAGPASAPARVIHDSVTRGVYQTVRGAGAEAGVLGGKAVSLLGVGGQPAGRGPGGNLVLAALNAVAGDKLEPPLPQLAIHMAVRADGCDVRLTARDLSGVFGHPAQRLAVFVHGLAETEDSWQRRGAGSEPYGPRLEAEFGFTPVYIRYNTGRHISDNGRDLAGLLDDLIAAWPEQVDELLLVGHSMGGLVIRSARHYGQQESAAWVDRVRHVFYLGSPHLGAPLARAAGFAGWALGKAAETRPFVTLVNGSSPGIKDLRHGYVLADDWADCDQDSCMRDHRRDTPLLAGASH
jgi:pimeloyl-ACP methyl ester carboxylesterase